VQRRGCALHLQPGERPHYLHEISDAAQQDAKTSALGLRATRDVAERSEHSHATNVTPVLSRRTTLSCRSLAFVGVIVEISMLKKSTM
jgi:hypothetical protein